MSNVTPIRACECCEKRLLDVRNCGDDVWLCGGCYALAMAEFRNDPEFTEDPDDETSA